jgi:hypothetical protein
LKDAIKNQESGGVEGLYIIRFFCSLNYLIRLDIFDFLGYTKFLLNSSFNSFPNSLGVLCGKKAGFAKSSRTAFFQTRV